MYIHTPSNSPLSSSDLILEHLPHTSTAPHRWLFTGRPDATFKHTEKKERQDVLYFLCIFYTYMYTLYILYLLHMMYAQ